MLKQELSDSIVEGMEERYQFTWPDKRKAILNANTPINKTLRPCREESVNFDNTENLYIEGDNLEVLKLLQETYLSKVKMIYIDPPYNTGNDFVYNDDFSQDVEEYVNNSGQLDEVGNRLVENKETNGRFHTDWLNMMYPRLKIAKDLLSDDGVIFISIDENEVDNLRKVCDEIFGAHNFLTCFTRVTKKAGKTTDTIAKNHDYILTYSKTGRYKMFLSLHTDEGFKNSDKYELKRGKYKLNQTLDYDSLQYSKSLDYPINIENMTLYPGQSYENYLQRQKGNHSRADWAWRWSKELFEFGYENGFIVLKKNEDNFRIYTKTYQNCKIIKKNNKFQIEYIRRTKPISTLEFVENEYSNDNSKKNIVKLFNFNVFDYSKPVSLLKKITEYASHDTDIVLDFFSGSATMAHAVMRLNSEDGGHRKFIMVQIPAETDEMSEAYKNGYKNICEIGKERIRRAGKKIKEENPLTTQDLDIGFRVLKCDSSNMKDVYYTPKEYMNKNLSLFEDNIKEDRTDEDLLFQVMLDLGAPLSSTIEKQIIKGKEVYNVAGGHIIACFAENIDDDVVTAIAKEQPSYFVTRDKSLADDSVAANFEQIFKTYGPNTEVRIL